MVNLTLTIDLCQKWIDPFKKLLWEGKVEDVINMLEQEGNKMRKNQTPIWKLRGYFVNNKDGMKYAEFRSRKFHIGSGAIESANKYIVANRLKQAGMRWTLSHANSMTWIRSKYFEDRWDAFWDDINLEEYFSDHESVHMKKTA